MIRTEGFAVHPTFSVSPALPAGVTLDPSNGVVSGTASTALREVITLTATAGGVSGSASLLLTIDPTLSVLASYVPLTAGTAVDRALFTANGFPGPVTYTVEPALPPGLRITADGSLVGTPTSASDFSTYVVTAVSGRWVNPPLRTCRSRRRSTPDTEFLMPAWDRSSWFPSPARSGSRSR